MLSRFSIGDRTVRCLLLTYAHLRKGHSRRLNLAVSGRAALELAKPKTAASKLGSPSFVFRLSELGGRECSYGSDQHHPCGLESTFAGSFAMWLQRSHHRKLYHRYGAYCGARL